MFEIVFNGNLHQYADAINGFALAKELGIKGAVAFRFNGAALDLTRKIDSSGTIEFITKQTQEGLEILRHDCAHALAQAVKEIYGKKVQITIGPAIKDGFYYDFYREQPFTPDELTAIEEKMHELIAKDITFMREVWQRDTAIDFFKSQGEIFKAELIESFPAHEDITLYKQGEFYDLCRGPHMPSMRYVGKAFKLTKIAGAYWRGDSNNPMLQRIYGTVWPSKEELDLYLERIAEAEKRDHRKLGPALGLFHLEDSASGSVFWHAKGWQLFRIIEDLMRKEQKAENYIEVKTPILFDNGLWQRSGHWDKFRENMFDMQVAEKTMVLKPMNCPAHVQIFNQGIKSYRDLPLRMAEFGCCHRNEASGALHGLMRVRNLTQDDAHIFCTLEQIVSETRAFCSFLKRIYAKFGFEKIIVKFADRPDLRAGDDATWDMAEDALRKASIESGLEFSYNPGEGAFYGPKLEFVLQDAMGRDWQCGTLQVDLILPERLNAYYVAEDGKKYRPVMLHRVILGSFERFIGILIEHYAGAFPFWLAPIQLVVASITDESKDYAIQVHDRLKHYRAILDVANEKINYKVREYSTQKIPYILVVGKKEQEQQSVSIRTFGSSESQTIHLDKLEEFLAG